MLLQSKSLVIGFFLLSFLLVIAGTSHAAVDIDHNTIRLQSLNKATAQTSTFEVKVGETIKIGPLYIRPQACRTTPATEEPESAGFIQIWTVHKSAAEENNEPKAEWVFSGWMFASSPGLSSMDHSVYDLWVLGCGEESIDLDGDAILVSAEGEMEIEALNGTEPLDDDFVIGEPENNEPIVKLDGQDISVPEVRDLDDSTEVDGSVQNEAPPVLETAPTVPDVAVEMDAKFQEYEEESDPIVHLE